jgi:hypothetical protein
MKPKVTITTGFDANANANDNVLADIRRCGIPVHSLLTSARLLEITNILKVRAIKQKAKRESRR